MKEVTVWLVISVVVVFVLRYTYQIYKKEINPTLSTWIIFLLGTGLSLATYAIAEDHDFQSGILNIMDFSSVVIVLIAIIIWGDRGVRFSLFDKWYLGAILVIISYGLFSGDAWGSNIFTQVLITLAYVPMIKNMITEKKNNESFTGWGCGLLAGVFALYPAIEGGNTLALVYSVKTIVLVFGVLVLMTYYEFFSEKKS